MDLVDLARTPEEKRAEAKKWEEATAEDRPDYPYGLTLYLDYDTMKKLGLEGASFDAGQPVTIHAVAMITEDRVEIINKEKRHCMSLQVQKMALSQEAPSDTLKTLYGA